MVANDFEYDGLLASDFGFCICRISNHISGVDTITAGAELNFNQVGINGGSRFEFSNTTYDSPLETTFQICKQDYQFITLEERREIARWLSRKEPHLFRVCDPDHEMYDDIVYEGSFNLRNLYLEGNVIGIELHFKSIHPYALHKKITKKFIFKEGRLSCRLVDISDQEGYIYPDLLTIKCKAAGELTIKNSLEVNRIFKMKNVRENEILTFDSSLNFTSTAHPNVQDDFNYTYFRIANIYKNNINLITVSLPCEMTIEYTPIIKGAGL